MRIIVIGLGSMGKRRIRLMKELFPDYEILGVDAREDRRAQAEALFGIETRSGLNGGTGPIDCAFVCTPPLSHAVLIRACLTRGWNVFTELNLVDTDYEENMRLAREKGCTLFLSSTFLFREETRYIQSRVQKAGKWNYLYHIGQYLPDWHPWERVDEYFISDQRTNGCREILAIELPWLTKAFGPVVGYQVLSDQMSSLRINYRDNYLLQFQHANGHKGVVAVDVVSPVAIRDFQAYTEGGFLSWKGTPESLLEFDPQQKKLLPIQMQEKAEHLRGYSEFIVENAYGNEITAFFQAVSGVLQPSYGFEQDQKILRLIDAIGV